MKKRIISAALAALMAVSAFSTTAFAALEADNEIEASSITAVPTLKVTVPTSMGFIINPYRLSVDTKGSEVETGGTATQVIAVYNNKETSPDAWTIKNESSVKVKAELYVVYANENSKELSFTQAASAAADTNTTKKKVVNFQIMGKADADDSASQITAVDKAPDAWSKNYTMSAKTGKLDITFANAATVDGDYAWSADDAITLTYAFKFSPVANAAS